MGFDSHNDLEFGPIKLGTKAKAIIDIYKKNKKHLKKYISGFIMLAGVLICKAGFENVDTVVHTASAITFEEPVYEPFHFSEEVIPKVESKTSKTFPVKSSEVNWKAQAINIATFQAHVLEYLKASGYECIHARHFNVAYDILVFSNVTMINPVVLKESDEKVFLKEVALDETILRVKRPIAIEIRYLDDGLQEKNVVLYGIQSACFGHYEF